MDILDYIAPTPDSPEGQTIEIPLRNLGRIQTHGILCGHKLLVDVENAAAGAPITKTAPCSTGGRLTEEPVSNSYDLAE